MSTISLCMIVKDEERILERQLRHIKDHVDEIIIVDTGSKDRTKEIAKRYTDKVYDFEWCDDFSKAWNFSISKASKEWLLILAADEFVENPERLKELINGAGSVFFNFRQLTAYVDYERLDKDKYKILDKLNNSAPHYKTKLIRRSLKASYRFPVHEVLVIQDKDYHSVKTDIRIFHLKEAAASAKDAEYYSFLCKKAINSGNFDWNIVCNLIDYYLGKGLFKEVGDVLEKGPFEMEKKAIPYTKTLIHKLLSLNRKEEAEKLSYILEKSFSETEK